MITYIIVILSITLLMTVSSIKEYNVGPNIFLTILAIAEIIAIVFAANLY